MAEILDALPGGARFLNSWILICAFDGGGRTTAVADVVTGPPVPAPFVADTCTRRRCRTSLALSRNVRLVAPRMAPQPVPERLQSSHRYEYPVGLLSQRPVDAVSTWPWAAVPEMLGGVTLAGGGAADPITVGGDAVAVVAPVMVGVGGAVAWAWPAGLMAVIVTSRVEPTSAGPRV